MSGVSGLGSIGITVRDLPRMVDFYTRILGFTVTDGGPDATTVFLSSDPDASHHDVVLSVSPEPTNAQQISFTVGSLGDLRDIYRLIKAEDCAIERVVSHGIAFGCYFRDIEDNVLEVYWPTGMDYPQPIGVRIDLERSDAELMQLLEDMAPYPSETPRFYGRDVGKRLVSDATLAAQDTP